MGTVDKMKSPKLVLVEWIDACHADSGWQFGGKPDVDFDPVYSIGFLVEKRKQGILLAQTWFPGDYANVIAIPKGMIKKITVLGDIKG
jgi:hypothetical protein